MSSKKQNKITRADHERIEMYDWALDPEMNEDFTLWLEELNKYN